MLGPGPAEKAFRAAGQAATDGEKRVRYLAVERDFPDTDWARKARAQISELLHRDLAQIRASAWDPRIPFRDVSARIDALRGLYPDGAKTIDQAQAELDRARAVARTKDFAEVLKSHRPLEKGGDKSERFKDFTPPETIRKVGEGAVIGYLRVLVFLFMEAGGRVEEAEVNAVGTTLQDRKEATVPVKAVLHNLRTRERTPHKYLIQWIWQEGDWYLPEKAVQEER
jgi:hypothetical protein